VCNKSVTEHLQEDFRTSWNAGKARLDHAWQLQIYKKLVQSTLNIWDTKSPVRKELDKKIEEWNSTSKSRQLQDRLKELKISKVYGGGYDGGVCDKMVAMREEITAVIGENSGEKGALTAAYLCRAMEQFEPLLKIIRSTKVIDKEKRYDVAKEFLQKSQNFLRFYNEHLPLATIGYYEHGLPNHIPFLLLRDGTIGRMSTEGHERRNGTMKRTIRRSKSGSAPTARTVLVRLMMRHNPHVKAAGRQLH